MSKQENLNNEDKLDHAIVFGVFIFSLIGVGFIFLLLIAAICNWIQHDSATDIGHWVKQFNEASK